MARPGCLRNSVARLRHCAMYSRKGGYGGPKLRDALLRLGRRTPQPVRRCGRVESFAFLARRWGVGRTFAWLGRCRRLAGNPDKTVKSAEAWPLIACTRRLTRRIAKAWVFSARFVAGRSRVFECPVAQLGWRGRLPFPGRACPTACVMGMPTSIWPFRNERLSRHGVVRPWRRGIWRRAGSCFEARRCPALVRALSSLRPSGRRRAGRR